MSIEEVKASILGEMTAKRYLIEQLYQKLLPDVEDYTEILALSQNIKDGVSQIDQDINDLAAQTLE